MMNLQRFQQRVQHVVHSMQSTRLRSIHFSRKPDDPPRHVLTISDLSKPEIIRILRRADEMKQNPHAYTKTLANCTLLMLFEKPSLRTRLSFETGMTQLGGHAIYYPLDANAPLGQKEAINDTAIVASRYADVIMARIKSREKLRELAKYSSVPVINALDDFAHPCQILADLQTIFTVKHRGWRRSRDTHHAHEHLEATDSSSTHDYDLSNVKIAYVGDIANNVTYDLMRVAAMFGADLRLAGPVNHGKSHLPESEVIDQCERLNRSSHGSLRITHDPVEAVRGADVVFTDTWHSYHLSASQSNERESIFGPYRVTSDLMSKANKSAIFMHCLPAQRGVEVEAAVMDGPQSVIYDEAENRMHAQKSLMTFLLDKYKPS